MGTTIKKIAYKSDIDRFIWRGQVQLTIERIFPDGSTIKIIRIRYIDEEIKSMKVEVKRITNDEKEENSFENQEIFTEEQIRSGDLSESKPFTFEKMNNFSRSDRILFRYFSSNKTDNSFTDYYGGFSFSLRHLLKTNYKIGWFYLLSENIAMNSNLETKPLSKIHNKLEKKRRQTEKVLVKYSKQGYGFSVTKTNSNDGIRILTASCDTPGLAEGQKIIRINNFKLVDSNFQSIAEINRIIHREWIKERDLELTVVKSHVESGSLRSFEDEENLRGESKTNLVDRFLRYFRLSDRSPDNRCQRRKSSSTNSSLRDINSTMTESDSSQITMNESSNNDVRDLNSMAFVERLIEDNNSKEGPLNYVIIKPKLDHAFHELDLINRRRQVSIGKFMSWLQNASKVMSKCMRIYCDQLWRNGLLEEETRKKIFRNMPKLADQVKSLYEVILSNCIFYNDRKEPNNLTPAANKEDKYSLDFFEQDTNGNDQPIYYIDNPGTIIYNHNLAEILKELKAYYETYLEGCEEFRKARNTNKELLTYLTELQGTERQPSIPRTLSIPMDFPNDLLNFLLPIKHFTINEHLDYTNITKTISDLENFVVSKRI